MNRHLLVVFLMLGLLALMAGAANALTPVLDGWPHHWPNWSDVNGTFSSKVSVTQTATGWDYTLNVDPTNLYPGWGVQAFAVYFNNIATPKYNGWANYDGGNSPGWSHDGGWVMDRYPGPANTTGVIGWVTWNGPAYYLYSGNTAVFHAINMPTGFQDWGLHFAVSVVPTGAPVGASCDGEYWAPVPWDGGPPQDTPEPGSLALLTLGSRRRVRRTQATQSVTAGVALMSTIGRPTVEIRNGRPAAVPAGATSPR